MAQRFDVPARLAEGRAAVQNTHTYVSACRLRGFAHPDLTASVGQVWDWYDSEDGLDLQLLDDDCAELRAVLDAAAEALRMQRGELGELAAAWAGPGADEAAGFLQRHCDSGAAVVAGLQVAAEACGALRDELWRVVDAKVTAAVDIDDRAGAQRRVWLAAAQTVLAGGEQPAAGEVVDQQVTPYVDNDIRADWLVAMRSGRAAVAAAYDAATSAVPPGPAVVFPIPGRLGPSFQPAEHISPAAGAPVAPAAAVSPAEPPPAPPEPPAPAAPAAPLDDPVPAPLGDTAGWPASGGLPADLGLPTGGGLPTGAGSLGGLIPRIADAIGSLLGSPGDDTAAAETDEPFEDAPEADEPDETDESDEPDEPGEADDPDEPDEPGEADDPQPVAAEPAPDDPGGPAPTEDAVAAPTDQPVAAVSPGEPEADGTERSPCEIAADDLPQAGR